MGITVNQFGLSSAKEIYVPSAHWKAFQELVQRGANLWPDAPPEVKEFADMVTSGKVLQDYRQQNTSQKKG